MLSGASGMHFFLSGMRLGGLGDHLGSSGIHFFPEGMRSGTPGVLWGEPGMLLGPSGTRSGMSGTYFFWQIRGSGFQSTPVGSWGIVFLLSSLQKRFRNWVLLTFHHPEHGHDPVAFTVPEILIAGQTSSFRGFVFHPEPIGADRLGDGPIGLA